MKTPALGKPVLVHLFSRQMVLPGVGWGKGCPRGEGTGLDLWSDRLQRGQEGVKLTKYLLYICWRQSWCTAAAASSVAAAPRVSIVRVPYLLPLTICE